MYQSPNHLILDFWKKQIIPSGSCFFGQKKNKGKPKKYVQQPLLWLQLLCQKKTNAFWASSPFLPGFFPRIFHSKLPENGAFWGGGCGEFSGKFGLQNSFELRKNMQLSSRPFTAGWEFPPKWCPKNSGLGIILCPGPKIIRTFV